MRFVKNFGSTPVLCFMCLNYKNDLVGKAQGFEEYVV
jgi:hypothetical protein